jgi:ABC-type lipoprotein export system ATPase subunit
MDKPGIIYVEDARKEYVLGRQVVRALDGVTLSIDAGEMVALAGPSGSGKSTLLNLLGGLDRPQSGSVFVAGQEIGGMDPRGLCYFRRRYVGFVFQSLNLIGTLTALENVEFPMIFSGAARDQTARKARAQGALESVGLGDRLHHRPNELSGGQQQRVAIARALVNDPPIILADEPTGNLDQASGLSVMELLTDLNQSGRTVIMVTHDPRTISYARRTFHLLDGRVVEQSKIPLNEASDSLHPLSRPLSLARSGRVRPGRRRRDLARRLDAYAAATAAKPACAGWA